VVLILALFLARKNKRMWLTQDFCARLESVDIQKKKEKRE
jgi:hypothetical protein